MTKFDTEQTYLLPPIPIKELDDEYVSTDGHTRLLAWHLKGYSEVVCEWEEIAFDWDEYRIYVKWCKDAGITSIVDLKDRIINPLKYQELWLNRCKTLQESRKGP